jgi:hypothetical protein
MPKPLDYKHGERRRERGETEGEQALSEGRREAVTPKLHGESLLAGAGGGGAEGNPSSLCRRKRRRRRWRHRKTLAQK